MSTSTEPNPKMAAEAFKQLMMSGQVDEGVQARMDEILNGDENVKVAAVTHAASVIGEEAHRIAEAQLMSDRKIVRGGSTPGKIRPFSKAMLMAALAGMKAYMTPSENPFNPWTPGGLFGEPAKSHNRNSKHRVAMDKRAATKARNVKRHKKACR